MWRTYDQEKALALEESRAAFRGVDAVQAGDSVAQ
jgi:hypothetical protein